MADGARVTGLELSAPLPAIEARVGDRDFPKAWVLLRLFGNPVGVLFLDFPASGVLDPEVIAAAAMQRHGAAINARLAALGAERLETLPVTGIPAVARPDRSPGATPPITVVICTRNRPRDLERALDSLCALEYPNFRVLVVDNAPSDDATAKVVDAAAARLKIDYLLAPEPGLSRARNVAVAARPDDILAWTDDDVTVDPTWLTEVARALAEYPRASVICGAVVPAVLDSQVHLWFEEFGGLVKGRGFEPAVFDSTTRRTQSPLYPLPPFGAGANMTTRPGVIADIGGFDAALGAGTPAKGGEDTLAYTQLLLRGHTIVYYPAALVHHTHRSDLTGLRNQLFGYGVGITAFYTALLRRRPWLVLRLAALLPGALWDIFARRGKRAADIPTDFPPELLGLGRAGMLRGPGAYLRGRRQDRRQARRARTA